MRHLEPTVRQLQPLGRRRSEPVMEEHADARAAAADTSSPGPIASTRPRLRWMRRLTARARPSA